MKTHLCIIPNTVLPSAQRTSLRCETKGNYVSLVLLSFGIPATRCYTRKHVNTLWPRLSLWLRADSHRLGPKEKPVTYFFRGTTSGPTYLLGYDQALLDNWESVRRCLGSDAADLTHLTISWSSQSIPLCVPSVLRCSSEPVFGFHQHRLPMPPCLRRLCGLPSEFPVYESHGHGRL